MHYSLSCISLLCIVHDNASHYYSDWWLFCVDTGTTIDIDMHQFKYFSQICDARLTPNSRVVVITHEPTWLLDAYKGKKTAVNLGFLIRYVRKIFYR